MEKGKNDRQQHTDDVRRTIEQRRSEDFSDPAKEWRRVFAEAWGTFLLVLVAVGGHLSGDSSGWVIDRGFIEMAPGLIVMAVIYAMGSLSGAHINPAVTLAFALRRNFPWRRVPGYLAAQIIGGAAAVFFLAHATGDSGTLGALAPRTGLGAWQVFAIEAMLTAGLVTTILGTAAGARNIGKLGGMAVGGYIAAAGIWAAPLTGASMNPARALGPDLVRGDFSTTIVYVLGPLAGAVIGVGLEWIIKGKPTLQGTKEAQGAENFKEK